MEDPPGSYAPRSPDLSALTSSSAYTNSSPANKIAAMSGNAGSQPYLVPPQTTSHPSSYAQPPQPVRHDSFSLPQTSYYQPPSLLQSQSSSSYGYSSYPQAPPHTELPDSPQNKRIKRDTEDDDWNLGQLQQQQQQPTRPGRPPLSKKGSKSSPAAAAAAKTEEPQAPREPAPGEAEGIVVKTKFPVARIKRIVQADDEVGKVAQVTPVAVGKALELFMIHVTLSSASIAAGGGGGDRKGSAGSKRITSAHIKSAILKHDEFDFLRPIADKIPDGPAGGSKGGEGKEGKGGKGKVESEEDAEADMDADDGDAYADDGSDGTYGSRSKRKGSAREKGGRRMQSGLG